MTCSSCTDTMPCERCQMADCQQELAICEAWASYHSERGHLSMVAHYGDLMAELRDEIAYLREALS